VTHRGQTNKGRERDRWSVGGWVRRGVIESSDVARLAEKRTANGDSGLGVAATTGKELKASSP